MIVSPRYSNHAARITLVFTFSWATVQLQHLALKFVSGVTLAMVVRNFDFSLLA
jgi:hypothetical protein